MNFLVHLYLSGNDPGLIAGNLLGDFVKGRLSGEFPPAVERGIRFHRRIDSFSARNIHYATSRRRISPSFGHYRGVLVDIFYDHFLAREWPDYSCVAFETYLYETLALAGEYGQMLNDRLGTIFPYIFSELIPSYVALKGIERALTRISRRLKRENRLGEGGKELEMHYEGLRSDFRLFLPELVDFATKWKENISYR